MPTLLDEVEAWTECLRTGSRSERCDAARALARLGPRAANAAPYLVAGLRDPELDVRADAASALARLRRGGVPALIAALRDEDPDFRKAVVVTLGKIGPAARDAIGVLESTADDEFLAPWAERALRSIRRGRVATFASEHETGLRRSLWVMAFLDCLALVALMLWWESGQAVLSQSSVAAALVMAFVGGYTGALVGASRWGLAGAIPAGLVFGVGGGIAGLLIGGIMGIFVEPVVRALGPH